MQFGLLDIFPNLLLHFLHISAFAFKYGNSLQYGHLPETKSPTMSQFNNLAVTGRAQLPRGRIDGGLCHPKAPKDGAETLEDRVDLGCE